MSVATTKTKTAFKKHCAMHKFTATLPQTWARHLQAKHGKKTVVKTKRILNRNITVKNNHQNGLQDLVREVVREVIREEVQGAILSLNGKVATKR